MHVTLNSLHVFDAAARHLSFKDAASEINLSPSAVSHAIAKLERELGVLLFDRHGRILELTDNGKTLHGSVAEGLTLVRSALNLVAGRQASVLRLHAAPSFAAQWLTPRLHHFLASNPGMEVQIAADADYSRFTDDQFDADIVYSPLQIDGLVSHPLGEERIRPMCAPALAERIHGPTDLLRYALIHSTLKSVSWDDWLSANGVEPARGSTMRFERSFMAISAAANGIGICLESTLLAQDELASGRLVVPLEGFTEDPIETCHYLVYPQRNAARPIVKSFKNWLLGELAENSDIAEGGL